MGIADQQSHIFSLQLQIKIKKQIFDEAIRNDKEFSYVKQMYLELKELEKQLEGHIIISQKQYERSGTQSNCS
jgi:hypothetical protein